MKHITIYLLLFTVVLAASCRKDSDFLDRKPTDVVAPEEVWKDKNLVLSVLAGFYDRFPDYQRIDRWWEFSNFDEAFPSAAGDYWRIQSTDWAYDWWSSWDYAFIRDLNMFIQAGNAATELDAMDKDRFLAEARFIRASVYFDLVKKMGGVPLILEPMDYDFSGDPTYLRHPRAKESEVYDFVLGELEAIKDQLPEDGTQTRATWGAALATEARAALYAGSVARYGAATPEVSLPGGEVGIPKEKAEAYYEKAFAAAKAIIDSKTYSLYQKKDDLSENFASLFTDKAGNPEVIFARDYLIKAGKTHGYTLSNQPRTSAEEQQGGRLNPSLNLAEEFELLNNTFAPFKTNEAAGGFAFYNNIGDIFAGRDARLRGTIIIPGDQFKGITVDIWAGWQLANGSVITGDQFGQIKDKVLPGDPKAVQVVGKDGPIDALEFGAQTGFFVRKYMDPNVGSGRIGTQSDVWWIRYRYAEVLLNAAEAAFELGNKDVAAGYLNEVRKRAGLVTPLTAAGITFDRIVHERRVELAFEDHILWDRKRWRIAHKTWNGEALNATTVTQDLGSATRINTMVFGLWPYKYYDPSGPNNGKYIFKVVKPSRVSKAHNFRMGNYYSLINASITSNNPLIVKQPNQ
ncbi:RagB/SusD family nutrient uptake outer membrane protein [Niabella drilacis]|uniref:Starch-binding associating with outer membrane n=1 Tax=Niabella drilacis (strain DSM 25811 / CCM 8410 / CCUG 62505 / LMG 26954 / E90) TaxID=1285928 RepID=A0A1G6TZD7_NIADE|nr:RagB/SusD family nutrient uptake outer membrane protein [Niabella drilacis]SDD33717.1 Starch-binding associating with outer membrane [Niabella drilacis]